MRAETIYKRAFNDMLDMLEGFDPGMILPSENALCATLDVSRTTVRKVLHSLADQGLITESLPRRRMDTPDADYSKFPDEQTVPQSKLVETRFMQWIHESGTQPGTVISELELARKLGVATTILREFLNRFQRFGLIEKRHNTGWLFNGFTRDFALELFEVRQMFEMRSAMSFASAPENEQIRKKLIAIRAEHLNLLDDVDDRYHDFSDLDSRFHLLVNSVIPNRFIDSFYDTMTLIFHYHYQWRKHDERQRNEVAIREHLNYIDALLKRDPAAIEEACQTHLNSARETLLRSSQLLSPADN